MPIDLACSLVVVTTAGVKKVQKSFCPPSNYIVEQKYKCVPPILSRPTFFLHYSPPETANFSFETNLLNMLYILRNTKWHQMCSEAHTKMTKISPFTTMKSHSHLLKCDVESCVVPEREWMLMMIHAYGSEGCERRAAEVIWSCCYAQAIIIIIFLFFFVALVLPAYTHCAKWL